MKEKIIECKWNECEYSYQSYYENDTGYREYMCELTDDECIDEICPIACKYRIYENGEELNE